MSERVCPSVAAGDPERVVLSYLSGNQLFMLRANGRPIRVAANANPRTHTQRVGDLLVAIQETEGVATVTLVDRTGNVIWSYSGDGEVSSVGPSTAVWVSEGGNAAFTLSEGSVVSSIAVLSTGQATSLPARPLGPPDAYGWVPVGDQTYLGFANVSTGERTRGTQPLAHPTHLPFVSRGRVVYLSTEFDETQLSVLTTGDEHNFSFETTIDLTASTLLPTEVGAVLVEGNLPRFVLNADMLELHPVAPVSHGPLVNPTFWTHGVYGLVLDGQVPRAVIDLRTGTTFVLAPPPLQQHDGGAVVVFAGSFALGGSEFGPPSFFVNLENRGVLGFNGVSTSPFAPFAPSNCMPLPELLDDSTVALGVRDESIAMVMSGRFTSFPWAPLGRPVSHVVGIGARRYSDAWIVWSDSGEFSFCSGGDWPPPETLAEETLLGNSVQVILANGEVAFPDHRLDEFVFHESGLCGAVRGAVHDFQARTRFELPTDASQLIFW